MRKRTPFVLIAVIAIPLLVVLVWAATLGRVHWFMVARYRSMAKPISFYGQVVDQHGKPIPKAAVSIVIAGFNSASVLESNHTSYMAQDRLTRETDAEGRFAVEGTTGMHLYVERVACPGYVAIPEEDGRGRRPPHIGFFTYEREPGVAFYVPDPNKPAIFPLHKLGEQQTLLPSRGGRDEPNP